MTSPVLLYAQISTETFETETNASTSFTDNSQVFNITSQARGPFDIQAAYPGTGWNGTAADNRYIDNSSFSGTGFTVGFTISSAGATPFKINSMYIFLSNSASLNQSVPGSLTIVGKLGGVTKFTATASSGFVTSIAVNNGFTFINMATFGGNDNSDIPVDQLVFTTGGQFEYLALDAFKWTKFSSLPVKLIDFTATKQLSSVLLQWQTASEVASKNFVIDKSIDGKNFTQLASIVPKGAGRYNFTDYAPNKGVNYYRLSEVDENLTSTELKIRAVDFSLLQPSIKVYPNPTQDIANVSFSAGMYQKATLTDLNQVLIKSFSIAAGDDALQIPMANLAPGVYLLSLTGKESERIKVVKQ